ncbi:TglA family RiPP precursor [Pantoea dispersa]|nr:MULTISPECIES: TglA family RiPP precursor [Pantoea]
MKPEENESEQGAVSVHPIVEESSGNLFEEFDLDDIEVIESKVFA